MGTPSSGKQGIAISPDGKHVDATGSFDDAVAILSRTASTGIAPIAPNGNLCSYVFGKAHLIIDVSGYVET